MFDPIFIVAINLLAPVATRGDVIDGTGKLDAHGAGHGLRVPGETRKMEGLILDFLEFVSRLATHNIR
jgi:hypothetical protein